MGITLGWGVLGRIFRRCRGGVGLTVLLGILTSASVSGAQEPSASDCSACVFGPRDYVRTTGAPTFDRASFNADPAADYVIDVDDRGTEGSDGTVTLNGAVILAPRALGETGPRHVRRSVTLLTENILDVRLTGKPGSQLSVRVLGGRKSVGPLGGTVTVPGGAVRLTIPPGALPSESEIGVARIEGFTPADVLDGVTPLGADWSLEPNGLAFTEPISVSINYADVLSRVPSPDNVGVVHSGDDGSFADPVSAVDDPVARTLTFSLSHFSVVSLVRSSTGFTTYRMRWTITPFDVSPSAESRLWTSRTHLLDYTTALPRIDFITVPTSLDFVCPSSQYRIIDQTGGTCMPAPGVRSDRLLDEDSRITIAVFESHLSSAEETATARMHQIGHALGMAHPWRLPASDWITRPDLYPVMSNLWHLGLPTAQKLVRSDLHQVDIDAIQSKYGVAMSPAISGVFPRPVTVSSAPQSITIRGANFVRTGPTALTPSVHFTSPSGASVAVARGDVTYVSSSELRVLASLGELGEWTVVVTNQPNRLVSNSLPFSVVPVGAPGVFSITEVIVGTGIEAVSGRIATVAFELYLYDATRPQQRGALVSQLSAFQFTLGAGSVISGFDLGVTGMRVGGQRRVVIPPSMAYGSSGAGPIPPNATLLLEVSLLNVR